MNLGCPGGAGKSSCLQEEGFTAVLNVLLPFSEEESVLAKRELERNLEAVFAAKHARAVSGGKFVVHSKIERISGDSALVFNIEDEEVGALEEIRREEEEGTPVQQRALLAQ